MRVFKIEKTDESWFYMYGPDGHTYRYYIECDEDIISNGRNLGNKISLLLGRRGMEDKAIEYAKKLIKQYK